MEHSYSLEHYREILKRAKQLGYRMPKLSEVAGGSVSGRWFLIRHDIDITPWAALTLANLEHEEGVHTSYYYRFHASTYNLMDAEVIASVKEVAAMGHEVGLHYEPGFFTDAGRDPVEGARAEIALLEDLIGAKTRSIAQHQPAQGPLLAEISKEHPCAYQEALVRDIPYFGDSGFHWREGCICTKLGQHDRLHTLIHPHSWTISGKAWQDVLREHAKDLGTRIGEGMEAYIQHVSEYLAKRERLDREREARY